MLQESRCTGIWAYTVLVENFHIEFRGKFWQLNINFYFFWPLEGTPRTILRVVGRASKTQNPSRDLSCGWVSENKYWNKKFNYYSFHERICNFSIIPLTYSIRRHFCSMFKGFDSIGGKNSSLFIILRYHG